MGLVPYDVEDADDVLGRAGVAARLRREDRAVVVVTPGARPMDALTVLQTTGSPPVLVVTSSSRSCSRVMARRSGARSCGRWAITQDGRR